MDACTPRKSEHKLVTVEDYERLIGAEAVERISRKAEYLRDLHVINGITAAESQKFSHR
jgi:hypothetical protein